MANSITFKVKVEKDGNLKVVAKEADKAAKSTDNLSRSTDTLNKKRNDHQKVEKGLGQTGLSAGKALSKQASAIQGGLVPAYAVLAAHVFAITAAFNALKDAAQVEVLEEGFTRLGNTAGRTATLMAAKLKDITHGAISTEEALKAASTGFSAGFSMKEMEGLAQVAKSASIALGRDLGDALDRLFRGTAKLEPEILDELGLFIRLDDAARDYAAQLGKTANELTNTERRQAFLNEALEQGARKFKGLEDVEPNQFNQLASTFKELTTSMLQIVNVALVPFMKFLAANTVILTGVMIAFGAGILKMMIPALQDFGKNVKKLKKDLDELTPSAIKAQDKITKLQAKILKGSKTSIKDKGGMFGELMGAAQKGGKGRASLEQLQQLDKLYTKSISSRKGALKKLSGVHLETSKANIAAMVAEQSAIKALMAAELERAAATGAATFASGLAEGNLILEESAAKMQQTGVGVGEAFFAGTAAMGSYKDKMVETTKAQEKLIDKNKKFSAGLKIIGGRFMMYGRIIGGVLRVIAAFLLSFAAAIGWALVGLGTIIAAFKLFSGATSDLAKAQDDLNTIMDSMPDKFDNLNKQLAESEKRQKKTTDETEKMVEEGFRFNATWKVLGGIINETTDAWEGLNKELANIDPNLWDKMAAGMGNLASAAADGARSAWDWTKNLGKAVAGGIKDMGDAIENSDIGRALGDKVGGTDGQYVINEMTNSMSDFYKEMERGLSGKDVNISSIFGGAKDEAAWLATTIDLAKLKQDGTEEEIKILGQLDALTSKHGAKEAKRITTLMILQQRAEVTGKAYVAATDGVGESMADAGKKTSEWIASLRKQSTIREVAKELEHLMLLMEKGGETLGGDANKAWAHQLTQNGAALENLGISVESVASQGKEAFTELVNSVVTLANAERGAKKEAEELKNQLADLGRGEESTALKENTDATRKAMLETGSAALTVKQESQLAADAAARRKTLIEKEATARKAIITQEFALVRAQMVIAKMNLKEGDPMLKELNDEIAIIDGIIAAKHAQIEAEKELTEEKRKQAEETRLLGVSSKTAAAVAGADGTTYGAAKALGQAGGMSGLTTDIDAVNASRDKPLTKDEEKSIKLQDTANKIAVMKSLTSEMTESLRAMGPEGELIATVTEGAFAVSGAWVTAAQEIHTGTNKMQKGAAIANAISATIAQTAAIMAASSKAKIAAVDKEIAQEKKRDGKSKESLAKIKSLEKKKEAMARKAFEQNKKMQMASIIANTAAGVMGVIGHDSAQVGILSIVLAGIVAAMGMAQLAMVAGTSYQGGGGSSVASIPSSISVGERSKSSDLSKSKSARGELAYFRGDQGVGGAENFRGAFYGKHHRAYGGNAGYIVGEQGPELFMPDRPGTIVPADDTEEMTSTNSNVTFNINAVDAAGVEDVLTQQQGHIISMLRTAANSYGEEFMEDIDDQVLTPHQGYVTRY